MRIILEQLFDVKHFNAFASYKGGARHLGSSFRPLALAAQPQTAAAGAFSQKLMLSMW